MSSDGFVHVERDGRAVLVNGDGASAPTPPAVDLTLGVIRNLTLNTDSGKVTWDQEVRLRMYRFTKEQEVGRD